MHVGRHGKLQAHVFALDRGEGVTAVVSAGGKRSGSERDLVADDNFCLLVVQGQDARRRQQVCVGVRGERANDGAEGDVSPVDAGCCKGRAGDGRETADRIDLSVLADDVAD